MPKHRHITWQIRREVCERYMAGEPVNSLKRTLGVHESVIRRLLHEEGVPLRRGRPPKQMSPVVRPLPPERRNGTKLTEEVRREIVDLYLSGLSCREVGERLHWSKDTIERALRQEGVPRRPGGSGGIRTLHSMPAEDEIAKCVELYVGGGMSMTHVGRTLGLKPETTKKRLQLAGVTLRTRSEQARLNHLASLRTHPSGSVLYDLQANGPGRLIEIARRTGLEYSGVGHMLNRLVTYELVERTGVGRATTYRARTEKEMRPVEGAQERLPIEPFRDWIDSLLTRERRLAEGVEQTDPYTRRVAEQLGVSERHLWRLLHENHRVSLRLADHMIQASGEPVTLWDFWPHLTEDELEPAHHPTHLAA